MAHHNPPAKREYGDQLYSFCSPNEEEDELTNFLMQMKKKHRLITGGAFVWCKFHKYPFWPAVVKSINHKMRRAHIVFIEGPLKDKICTGLTVSLKTLKPFDCEEGSQFVSEAKEWSDASIKWSLDMINDYRRRIACEHFTGSFLEYVCHDMSYPVRRTFPLGGSEETPTTSSDLEKMEECQGHEEEEKEVVEEERSATEQEEEEVGRKRRRRLPDRTLAAYNRANEKLVHYIVDQHMVEKRLLAVIGGQQRSSWLHSFLSADRRRNGVPVHLRGDGQVERVYRYLAAVLGTAPLAPPCMQAGTERVRFVLDVLLPEAVIHAIAGVNNVSVETAEQKYLAGRRISNREREDFEWLLEQEIKRGSRLQRSGVTSSLTHTE